MMQLGWVRPIVELRDFGRWIGLILTREGEDGDTEIASLSWAKRSGSEVMDSCVAQIQPIDAQSLMDALWRCGMRPAESVATEATMKAVQAHIDDLRKIVFKNWAP